MKINDNITVRFRYEGEKTSCIISAYGEETVGTVSRYLHKTNGDEYDKKVARKHSLIKALKLSTLSRDGRTLVWDTLKRHNVHLKGVKSIIN